MSEVCDHCGLGLGSHHVPDSRCPGRDTRFFIAAYHAPSNFQFCTECEHFRLEHENGTGYCRFGQSDVSDGCHCAEFETPSMWRSS